MKGHTLSKRLVVTKETLRHLEERHLRRAQGGQQQQTDPPEDKWTGDSKNVCCA